MRVLIPGWSAEQAREDVVEQQLFPLSRLKPPQIASARVLRDQQDAVKVGSDGVQMTDDGDKAAVGFQNSATRLGLVFYAAARIR